MRAGWLAGIVVLVAAGCQAIPTAADFDFADADGVVGTEDVAVGADSVDVSDVPPGTDTADVAEPIDAVDAADAVDTPDGTDAADVADVVDVPDVDDTADAPDVPPVEDVVDVADTVDAVGDAVPDVPGDPCAGKNCDDVNACTNDSCAAGNCAHTNAATACDDGNPCTTGDTCAAAACNGQPIDADNDGYGPGAACGGDCDDTNGAVFPGATELCNDINDNCNLKTDENCDKDGDHYCDANMVTVGKPTVCTYGGGDCDDTAGAGASVNPGKVEVCGDSLDNNCNGATDEQNASGCVNYYYDGDTDGYPINSFQCLCVNNPQGSLYSVLVTGAVLGGNAPVTGVSLDCNDNPAAGGADAYPSHAEWCDGVDNNCISGVDESCDKDGDHYCDATRFTKGTPAVCTKGGGDCNDAAGLGASVNPGVVETCNGIDDNCNGATDDGANCDDGNACTNDSCVSLACQHVNNTAVCSDGNACTTGDACNSGVCKGIAPVCGNGTCDCGESNASCAADCTSSTPAGMVLIPAGTFWMGCNATKDTNCSGNSNENPQHKVTLSAYYMDLTETTVTQYKACVDASVCTVPSTQSPTQYATYPGLTTNPVNHVSWTQSQAYCKWRGAAFDLPTEAQWEMAARGSCEKNGSTAGDAGCAAAMRTYPWGETAPTVSYAVFGVSSTAAVGSLPAGDSPYGLHDMAGNVWEWNRDWYSSTYYSSSPATDPYDSASASSRVLRGGYFSSTAVSLRAGLRSFSTPSSALSFIGLRCMRSYP